MPDEKKKKTKKAKVKKAVKRGSGGRCISMQTYRAIRMAYIEIPSITHAAREAGVNYATAARYIKEGRPEHHMPCIKNFAKAAAQKDTARLELTLKDFRDKEIKTLLEALAGASVELRLHNAKTKQLADKADEERKKTNGEIVEPSSSFINQIKAFDLLIRLAERMLGGPDETIRVEPQDFTSKMDKEECITYLKTGAIPEHLN